MAFWLIAAIAALVILAALAGALLRPGAPEAGEAAAKDIEVYRDQLRELDRDLARGTLPQGEAERARIEISRRLLDADRKARAAAAPGRSPRTASLAAIAAIGFLLFGGGYWTYTRLGVNRIGQEIYPDLPLSLRIEAAEQRRASRPDQAEAETRTAPWPGPGPDVPADYLDLVEKLRSAVAENPDDLEGQVLLAAHEAQLGNFTVAYRSQSEVIRLKGDAVSGNDYARLAEYYILAADGYISPEAEAALRRALELQPGNQIALYYTGLMYAQIGRPDLGFRIWRQLLERSPGDAPWVAPIRRQIGQLAMMAGVDYTLPPPAAPQGGAPAAAELSGPTPEDMAAAQDMTPEEREQMVRGMIEQLSERLATQGGTAPEWARLIGALGVQGETARAQGIWDEAQQVFAPYPDQLDIIRDAAGKAGLDLSATPPPPPGAAAAEPPGPTPDEMAAAQDMTPEERTEMIRGMVDQLAERLATEGGSAPEWARLISALGVLGEAERAQGIWDEAQQVFAPVPDQLAIVREAAQRSGLTSATPAPGATPAPATPDTASQAQPDATGTDAPAAEQHAPADGLSEADAQTMDNLATNLADRLASVGGPPEDWALLIGTYRTLNEPARAAAVWAEAQKVFAQDDAALEMIRVAAAAAGVAE